MTPINHPPIHPPNDRLDRPPSRSRALATTSSLPLDALPLLPPVASTRSVSFSLRGRSLSNPSRCLWRKTCVPDERAASAAVIGAHACLQISWDRELFSDWHWVGDLECSGAMTRSLVQKIVAEMHASLGSGDLLRSENSECLRVPGIESIR